MIKRILFIIFLSVFSLGHADNYSTEKLIAWCIVPFDSQKRRHTSFASIWVYPEVANSINIKIEPKKKLLTFLDDDEMLGDEVIEDEVNTDNIQ